MLSNFLFPVRFQFLSSFFILTLIRLFCHSHCDTVGVLFKRISVSYSLNTYMPAVCTRDEFFVFTPEIQHRAPIRFFQSNCSEENERLKNEYFVVG